MGEAFELSLKSGVSAAKEEEDDSGAASVADFEAEEFIGGDVSNLSPPLAYTTAAIEDREGGGGGEIDYLFKKRIGEIGLESKRE
jgi:hypothetical protein